MGVIIGIQVSSAFENHQCNSSYKSRRQNSTIISVDPEKSFDKIQYSLILKTVNEIGPKENFLILLNGI